MYYLWIKFLTFEDTFHTNYIFYFSSDFLLMLLTEILPFRSDLKVILMSATMDAQMFADYFGPNTPILTIPGTLMK